jgi:proton-translocating NAD(P)+ transhydrogenase subunit alpha
MKLLVLKETANNEKRVALTPDCVKKYKNMGFDVFIEKNAGLAAQYDDQSYIEQGANVSNDIVSLIPSVDVVCCVQRPSDKTLKRIKKPACLIGLLQANKEDCEHFKAINAFSMELIPRITRAQSMDVLSSQANLAGYKAVIDAVGQYNHVIPMMMTAAGMIHPAKVLILGAGVAGLQAIATAKRLGAIVYAFDVRASVKEQVESLSAEFIQVQDDVDHETKGGYAKEMSDDYKQKQAQLIDEYAKKCNIVITTALIPNKKAPILIKAQTVKAMKTGAVIVDLASASGGNCELSKNEEVIDINGVTIIGSSNLASRLAPTASRLYANNCLQFINLLVNDNTIIIDDTDEIINNTHISFDSTIKEASKC